MSDVRQLMSFPEKQHDTALACLCLLRAGIPEWWWQETQGGKKLIPSVGIMALQQKNPCGKQEPVWGIFSS